MRIFGVVILSLWALISMLGMFCEIMRQSKSPVRRVFRALTVPLFVAILPFMFLGMVAEEIFEALDRAEDKLVAFIKELADV